MTVSLLLGAFLFILELVKVQGIEPRPVLFLVVHFRFVSLVAGNGLWLDVLGLRLWLALGDRFGYTSDFRLNHFWWSNSLGLLEAEAIVEGVIVTQCQ